jgi:hypothetical protein
MRKGFDRLAALVQEKLAQDPFCSHLFVFRGRRGDLLKLLWSDGQGLCLFAKRLERSRFIWPSPADGKGTSRLRSVWRRREACAGFRLASSLEDKPSPTADDIAVSLASSASATSVAVPMLIDSSSDWTRFGDGIPLTRPRDAVRPHPNSRTCPRKSETEQRPSVQIPTARAG